MKETQGRNQMNEGLVNNSAGIKTLHLINSINIY